MMSSSEIQRQSLKTPFKFNAKLLTFAHHNIEPLSTLIITSKTRFERGYYTHIKSLTMADSKGALKLAQLRDKKAHNRRISMGIVKLSPDEVCRFYLIGRLNLATLCLLWAGSNSLILRSLQWLQLEKALMRPRLCADKMSIDTRSQWTVNCQSFYAKVWPVD